MNELKFVLAQFTKIMKTEFFRTSEDSILAILLQYVN